MREVEVQDTGETVTKLSSCHCKCICECKQSGIADMVSKAWAEEKLFALLIVNLLLDRHYLITRVPESHK